MSIILTLQKMTCLLALSSSAMAVLESVSNEPVLSIRATSLLRYYPLPPFSSNFPFIHQPTAVLEITLRLTTTKNAPPTNASVSFIGRVNVTNTADGCRFFSVQVTAFKHRDNGEPGYETFHLMGLAKHRKLE